MEFPPDWKEFLLLLNSANIEYLVIGAHAMAFYGMARYTADFDVFVAASAQTAERLIVVLQEFGFGNTGISLDNLAQPNKVFMLGVQPFRIDVLTTISGISFDEAWTNRVKGDLSGIEVWFISKEDLIKNKLSSGRPKDLADAQKLQLPSF